MAEERRWVQTGLLPLAWILVTGIGAASGVILGHVYNHTAGALWGWEIVDNTSVLFSLTAHGLLVGAGQALLMRRLIPKAWHWIVATLIGAYSYVLIFLVNGALYRTLSISVAQTLDTALFGVAFALPQWLVLRRRHPSSGLWIVVSVLAFVLAHWLAQTPLSQSIMVGAGAWLRQRLDARTVILVLSGFSSILHSAPCGAVIALAQGVLVGWWVGRPGGVHEGQRPL